MPPTAGESLVRVADVSRVLALSRSSVYALMEAGKLPYVKLGRSRRVRLEDIDRLIAASRVGGSGPR